MIWSGILSDSRLPLINRFVPEKSDDRFKYLQADVKDISWIPDRSFDISFSNSLIEHIGDLSAQAAVVREMLRVGTHLYLQTPNRNFFWEPHYSVPFVHWLSLPSRMKVLKLISGTTLAAQYDAYINDPVQLLWPMNSTTSPQSSFDCKRERLLGFSKSFVLRSRYKPF